jgi:mono/diheme cytochrome c family protein
MNRAIANLIVGLYVIGTGHAIAQDLSLDRGEEVFQYWCAPCHDSGPEMPGTQALQMLYKGQKPAVLEDRTDLLPEYTKVIVRNGISVMPFFRKTEISDEDLDALAAYLAE